MIHQLLLILCISSSIVSIKSRRTGRGNRRRNPRRYGRTHSPNAAGRGGTETGAEAFQRDLSHRLERRSEARLRFYPGASRTRTA